MDTCFDKVIEACAEPRKPKEDDGTWILPEMMQAYSDLHQRGYAHSIETWQESELVGGLYGISMGRAFFGESMFSLTSDASKVALVALAKQLKSWGFHFIDCQVSSEHLLKLGAKEVRRERFMTMLDDALSCPDRTGIWELDKEIIDQFVN